MSTTIDLTDDELEELKALTQLPDAEAAVRFAATEYLRFARRQQLKELSGRVEMEDNWQQNADAETGDPSEHL